MSFVRRAHHDPVGAPHGGELRPRAREPAPARPIRQRRAALRTLAGPSPAGSTLTTSTAGRVPAGSARWTSPSARPTSGQSERQRESRNAIRVTRPRVEASETLPPSTLRSVNCGARALSGGPRRLPVQLRQRQRRPAGRARGERARARRLRRPRPTTAAAPITSATRRGISRLPRCAPGSARTVSTTPHHTSTDEHEPERNRPGQHRAGREVRRRGKSRHRRFTSLARHQCSPASRRTQPRRRAPGSSQPYAQTSAITVHGTEPGTHMMPAASCWSASADRPQGRCESWT